MKNTTSGKYVLSKKLDAYFYGVNKAYRFTQDFFKQVVRRPFHFTEVINQCFEIGLRALPLISLTGFIIGIVFTKQSRPSLENFSATYWFPSLIGIAIVKALGTIDITLFVVVKEEKGNGGVID